MIKEPIKIKEDYFKVTSEIIKSLEENSLLNKDKLVIGVCGESASGKSVTAKCLKIELEKLGIECLVLHQDSYYKLPPKENHLKRKFDLNWVGPNEVKLDLLQSNIDHFKQKKFNIKVPIVNYQKNLFFEYNAIVEKKRVLIVEGVYTFLLKDFDYKIFMARTYVETMDKRKKRSREVYDNFVEQVLEIEHAIIAPLKEIADIIVDKNYKVFKT